MSPDQVKLMIQRAASRQRPAFRARLGLLKTNTRVQLANIDGLSGEAVPNLEVMQHFGFTSTPPDGTQAIVLPLGGRTSASVIIATEHSAHRLQLDNRGEAAIYTDDGTCVYVKRGGQVLIKADTRVLIDCPLTETSGDLAVGGDISAAGDITDRSSGTDGSSMSAMRAVFNGHTHDENGSSGPTDQPNQQM